MRSLTFHHLLEPLGESAHKIALCNVISLCENHSVALWDESRHAADRARFVGTLRLHRNTFTDIRNGTTWVEQAHGARHNISPPIWPVRRWQAKEAKKLGMRQLEPSQMESDKLPP